MFRRLTEPLPLSAASLLLLRPALNAPVLNVGYLPVGPARAAVVAFGEEYGGIGIALGVRSSEGGQLVVLRNQESIDFDVPLADALEPLLAEAERMGFLFDEDVFEANPGAAGRAQAMSHWADLMGGMESLIPPRAVPEDERRREDDDGPVGPLSPSLAVEEMQYPELMLDDVAPLVLDGDELGFADDEDETLESDLGDDFDDVLDDELGAEAAGEGWRLDAPLVGEADLTEPTAPILPAGRGKKQPLPVPPRSSSPTPPTPPAEPIQVAPTVAAVTPVAAGAPVRRPMPPEISAAPPAVAAAPIRTAPAPPVASPATVSAPQSVPVSPPPSPVPSSASVPVPVPAPATPVGVAEAAEAAPVEPAPSLEASRPAVASTSPRVVLSKFRQVEGRPAKPGAEKGEVGTDRSSELARIPIVRVRREGASGKRVPFLARLLSSF